MTEPTRPISPETVGWDEWQKQIDELRELWLSRLMFNMFVGWELETRTFEEFALAHGVEA